MSTVVEAWRQLPVGVEYPTRSAGPTVGEVAPSTESIVREQFESEQIRKLVRHLFLPGWPKALRQVVFSPVEEATDVAELCLRVAETLASQTTGGVCVVEANISGENLRDMHKTDLPGKNLTVLREQARQVSSNLWVMPQEGLMAGSGFESAQVLRARLAELRLEFDYCIMQGPAAASFGKAALLGHLCDGIVLVLQANATRRASALNVKKQLRAAHARLIGTVLTERVFPIPQFLYGRL